MSESIASNLSLAEALVRIQDLERELAEARKDSERIDFLEKEGVAWPLLENFDGHTQGEYWIGKYNGPLRAAIDEARRDFNPPPQKHE